MFEVSGEPTPLNSGTIAVHRLGFAEKQHNLKRVPSLKLSVKKSTPPWKAPTGRTAGGRTATRRAAFSLADLGPSFMEYFVNHLERFKRVEKDIVKNEALAAVKKEALIAAEQNAVRLAAEGALRLLFSREHQLRYVALSV